MKNKLFYLLPLFWLVSSCNDNFLSVVPRSTITTETYFQTESDAVEAVTGVYGYWGGRGNAEDGFPFSFFLDLADTWTDDAFCSLSGSWYQRFQRGNLSTADADLYSRWSELYFIIRRTNWVLANINRPVMDEGLRTRLTAETRLIRAHVYFLLYETWGEVPLVDQPLTVDELKVARAQPGGTVNFILNDLEFAIANLPTSYDASDLGRNTKGGAMGLKARLLLYEQRWAEAADAAQAVMNLGIYDLFQTTNGDGYRQQFKTQNKHNVEVILDRQNAAVPAHGNQLPRLSVPVVLTLNGSGFIAPSQSLMDSYEAYNPATDQIITVDPNNEFANRDPRLAYTTVYPGATLLGNTVSTVSTPTKYGTIKFLVDEFNGNNGGVDYAVNHILMRYSEILLTYAEAKIEANQIDQSVLDAINKVRARAYGKALNDTGHYPEITATDQATLRTIVRNERHVELALEGLRWFDIKRWGIGSQVLGKTMLGAKVNGSYTIVTDGGVFDPGRDYFRPIPQQERQLIGPDILSQNPGYSQ